MLQATRPRVFSQVTSSYSNRCCCCLCSHNFSNWVVHMGYSQLKSTLIPQHWAKWDEVGADQRPASRSHALLLWWEVHLYSNADKLTLCPAGSAIAWSLRGPRRRTSWATCSSTWSTSPASSSQRRRCARQEPGGDSAGAKRRKLLQSGKSHYLIETGVSQPRKWANIDFVKCSWIPGIYADVHIGAFCPVVVHLPGAITLISLI